MERAENFSIENLQHLVKPKTATLDYIFRLGVCNCGHTCYKGTLAAMTVKASGLAEVNDTGGFASSSKKDSTKKRKANEPPHQVC